MNKYEERIVAAKSINEMKEIVRKMFKDVETLDDIDFNEEIYHYVIPKLEQLGVVFDRENEIDYERVVKEEY